MLKNLLWMLPALVLMTSTSFAQDEEADKAKTAGDKPVQEEKQDDENSPKALLKKYKNELNKTSQAFSKRAAAIQKEFSDEEDGQEKIMEAFKGLREEMAESTDLVVAKIIDVAEMVEEDQEAALEATMFALQRSDKEAIKKKAAELIVKFHLDNEGLANAVGQLGGGMPSQATYELYQRIIDGSEIEKIKGMTSLAQAGFIEQLQQMSPMIMENPQIAETYPDLIEFVKSMKDELGDEAIMARYEKLTTEYGDIEAGNLTIGKLVGRKLKAIKTRAMTAVGKEAPEIEGPDIDGESFKLSDYRGKVVMLDFWGDW